MFCFIAAIFLVAIHKLSACHEIENQAGIISRGGSHEPTYISAAYYVNWAIYKRSFAPRSLPADKLTHVLYAFANVSSVTGEVLLSDPWADTEKHFEGDSGDETGNNLYGCFKQLYLLKKANRHLKVLLSIGGSSYSENFFSPISTTAGRSTFATTAVSLVANLGLDGIDIDWEFPRNDTEAIQLVLLLQSIREALDAYENSLSTPYHFQLTVAAPTGPSFYHLLHLPDVDRYIDFWFLMAYNYAGAWSDSTANQANLYPSASNPASTPFSSTEAINYYISKGITPSKIVLGMPIYGLSFTATDGLGKPFQGVGAGTWEAGIYDFKALPLAGATEICDGATGSSYSYDATSRELVSYDNLLVIKQKAAFIQQASLGGAMWWESSADKLGDESLIRNMAVLLDGSNRSSLERSQNRLDYPGSTFENLRAGMPGSNIIPNSSVTYSNLLTASVSSRAAESKKSSSTMSRAVSGDAMMGSAARSQFTASIHSADLSTTVSCALAFGNCTVAPKIFTTTILVSTTLCPVSHQPSSNLASMTNGQSVSGTSPAIVNTAVTNHLFASNITVLGQSRSTSRRDQNPSLNSTRVASTLNTTSPSIPSSISSTPVAAAGTVSSAGISVSSTSFLPSPIPTSSSSSYAMASSGCKTGATCGSYSGGTSFCGLDASNNPACFGEYRCLKSCTANDECSAGQACLIKSCCPPKKQICNLHNFVGCRIYSGGSTCAPLAQGCSDASSE